MKTYPRYPGAAPFIEARNYNHAAGSNGTITRIVIHDMEMAEKGDTAESCAKFFARTTNQASAHFTVDNNSVVPCVDLDKRAWHAPPNPGSVGIEHAGFANQKMADWLDEYGKAMLDKSAELTAWLCQTLGIPARWLSVADLRNGQRGLCTHADVSAAWHQTDHQDPGKAFPKDYYLVLVNKYLHPTIHAEDDVALSTEDANTIAAAVWNRFTVTMPDGSEKHLVDFMEKMAKDMEALKKAQAPKA